MPDEDFKFDTPTGWDICRRILAQKLPFVPHDFQLEGVAAILDGRDFLGVSPTGSGKSAYVYMTFLVMKGVLSDPSHWGVPEKIWQRFPPEPVFIVIYPTTALEEDQESKFRAMDLRAMAINSNTIELARVRQADNLWKLAETATDLVLLSPEMLSTPAFKNLIESTTFRRRVYAIAVDEVHLLASWGETFRQKSYKQIGFIRARFPDSVVLFAMTATLRKDQEKYICSNLAINTLTYKFLRCSNARPDIRLARCEWPYSQVAEAFPGLKWVLEEDGKTLIFCKTIYIGFRVFVYLMKARSQLSLPPSHRAPNLRLYNGLCSADFNRATLDLLSTDEPTIVVATDKLSVGIDIPDIQTAVVVDPTDIDDLWQKAGRVGRNKSVQRPQVIAYLPKPKPIPSDSSTPGSRSTSTSERRPRIPTDGKKKPTDLHTTESTGLVELREARCLSLCINKLYDNDNAVPSCSLSCPSSHPALPTSVSIFPMDPTCASCGCSGCQPDVSIRFAIQPPTRSTSATQKSALPLSQRITQDMRKIAERHLLEFRDMCWMGADEAESDVGWMLVDDFLPSHIIDTLIDSLLFPLTAETLCALQAHEEIEPGSAQELLAAFTSHNRFTARRTLDLIQTCLNIHAAFDVARGEAKARRREKRAAVDAEQVELDEEVVISPTSEKVMLRIDLRCVP